MRMTNLKDDILVYLEVPSNGKGVYPRLARRNPSQIKRYFWVLIPRNITTIVIFEHIIHDWCI